MKKRLPKLKTDNELDDLLKTDLSGYISPETSHTLTFEFEPKEKVVNLRMSNALLERVKKAAKERKIPYQRYIRQALELSVRRS